MDNYEYRMRTDEMRSFVEAGKYDKAMEIADSIDWRKVKSVPMLCLVSEIYENMESYQVSRDILFLAYDRQPTSRKIVYRLGILAIKIGDFKEAKDCYDEFVRLAPRDPNQFILRYKTLRAMKAPVKDQIDALRAFKKSEYVEKWAYELALLYQKSGMINECIAECDDLILWFSEGKYVYKAMELKMRYKPLSESQQVKFDSRFEREKTPQKPLLKHEAAQRLFAEKVLSPSTKTMPVEINIHPEENVEIQEKEEEKFDGGVTGTMKIEEILAEWEKTRSEMESEISKAESIELEEKEENEEESEEKIQTLSEDIRKLLEELEAEERGEEVTFSGVKVPEEEIFEEEISEEEILEEEISEEEISEEDNFEKDLEIEEIIEETSEPEDDVIGKTVVYLSNKEEDVSQDDEFNDLSENVVYQPSDYVVPDGEKLTLGMTDAIDFDNEDEKLREIFKESVIDEFTEDEKEVVYRPKGYKIPDKDLLKLTLDNAIDFDLYDEQLREKYFTRQGETRLFEPVSDDLVLTMEDAEDLTDDNDLMLKMEDAEDIDEKPTEVIEEIEEREKIIRKSPGGVVLDTAFKVQGRYDLSATSVAGTKAGLSSAEKEIFSYFVPIRGMSEQLYKVLSDEKNNNTRYGSSRNGNILISGEKGNGKTALAIDLMKAIQKNRNKKKGKVAIVKAEALNKKNMKDVFSQLFGGGLIIEKASDLNRRTIRDLNEVMEDQTGELIIILEDDKRSLEKLIHGNAILQRKFTSKISIPTLINDELVTFAQTYAKESNCRIDEMGILALYSHIDKLQSKEHFVTITEVKKIMDFAIAKARHGGVKHFFTTALNPSDGDIVIKEEHFKK